MFGRSKLVWMVALATIMSLVGGATAMAQAMPGSGSSAAMGNESGWVTLQPGQQHWYTFFSTSADSTATDAQIQITMASSPEGSASFNVWTPTNLQSAMAGNTDINAKPIGVGTLHPIADGASSYDLFRGNLEWTGRSLSPQTYLVQVESNSTTPVSYNLSVDGHYVTYPIGSLASQTPKSSVQMASATQQAGQSAGAAASANQQASMTAAASKTNSPAPVVLPSTGQSASPALGASPSMALSLDGMSRTINPGQTQWYVLQYPGELSGGAIPQASLELMASPQGTASFNVWTATGLSRLAAGDTTNGIPVGKGTMHTFLDGGVQYDRWGGNPQWTNKSSTPETFYIQVQGTGNYPTSYTLKYIQQ